MPKTIIVRSRREAERVSKALLNRGFSPDTSHETRKLIEYGEKLGRSSSYGPVYVQFCDNWECGDNDGYRGFDDRITYEAWAGTEETLPFKKGDKIRIESRPPTYSSAASGRDGRDRVDYPHTFTVEKIVYKSDTDHIAIYDGQYGWTYSDLLSKVGGSSKFIEVKDDDIKEIVMKRRRR